MHRTNKFCDHRTTLCRDLVDNTTSCRDLVDDTTSCRDLVDDTTYCWDHVADCQTLLTNIYCNGWHNARRYVRSLCMSIRVFLMQNTMYRHDFANIMGWSYMSLDIDVHLHLVIFFSAELLGSYCELLMHLFDNIIEYLCSNLIKLGIHLDNFCFNQTVPVQYPATFGGGRRRATMLGTSIKEYS